MKTILVGRAGNPAAGDAILLQSVRQGMNVPVLLMEANDGDRVRVLHVETNAAWSTDLTIVIRELPKGTPGIFPANVIVAAQNSDRRWGVPTSVTLAQWALESNWGSQMPEDSNNPFGIKAVGNDPFVDTETMERRNGKLVTVRANFKVFNSMNDAFNQHGALLATSPKYRAAMAVKSNPDAFANALTGVYATGENYGGALIHWMKTYNTYKYDLRK